MPGRTHPLKNISRSDAPAALIVQAWKKKEAPKRLAISRQPNNHVLVQYEDAINRKFIPSIFHHLCETVFTNKKARTMRAFYFFANRINV